MADRNSLRDRLRDATRRDHDAIDHAMSALELATPSDYVRFLGIHRAAINELSGRCREVDRADMAGMRRCLEEDLVLLGAHPPPMVAEAPTARSSGYQFGIAYVVRGSRLGAGVLRKRLAPGAPSAYLAYRPAISWPDFLGDLDAFSQTNLSNSGDEAVLGAQAAFQVFRGITDLRVARGVRA